MDSTLKFCETYSCKNQFHLWILCSFPDWIPESKLRSNEGGSAAKIKGKMPTILKNYNETIYIFLFTALQQSCGKVTLSVVSDILKLVQVELHYTGTGRLENGRLAFG